MQDLKIANELRKTPTRDRVEFFKREAQKLMRKDKSLTPEKAVNIVLIKKIKEIGKKFLNRKKEH